MKKSARSALKGDTADEERSTHAYTHTHIALSTYLLSHALFNEGIQCESRKLGIISFSMRARLAYGNYAARRRRLLNMRSLRRKVTKQYRSSVYTFQTGLSGFFKTCHSHFVVFFREIAPQIGMT